MYFLAIVFHIVTVTALQSRHHSFCLYRLRKGEPQITLFISFGGYPSEIKQTGYGISFFILKSKIQFFPLSPLLVVTKNNNFFVERCFGYIVTNYSHVKL